jgi:hypothetical protein
VVYPIASKKSVEKENKLMKFLRPALIVALLCVATAGAAFADDIHVVFDPQQMDPPNNSFTPVFDLTTPISFTWG